MDDDLFLLKSHEMNFYGAGIWVFGNIYLYLLLEPHLELGANSLHYIFKIYTSKTVLADFQLKIRRFKETVIL